MQRRRGTRGALSGEGSQGEPPGAGGGCSGSERRPSQCCSAAAAGGAARPRARGWAHGLGPAGVPEGGRGPGSGSGGLRAPAIQASGPRGGPRVRGADARASPPASGSPSAPRPPETPRPLPSLPSSDTPAPAGRKVTWAAQGAGRAAAWGRLAARPPGGGAQEARAWGGSRRRGLLARLPAPLCRGLGGSAELRRGHTPSAERAGESGLLPPGAGRGGGGGRPPQYFRTVTCSQPPPSWRGAGGGGTTPRYSCQER